MLLHGDCLEKLKELSENSVDAIITDPPYGINFMGKTWDDDCPSVEVWKECLRVLKPGGHLLSFSGTRTVDLIMGRIREAGFEVRDMISWLYGCYSSDTECLTKEGFKLYNDLKPTDEIMQWCKDTNALSWIKPLEKYEYHYKGKMINFKNRHTDQLLTPNHKSYVKLQKHSRDKKADNYECYDAGALKKHWIKQFPLAGTYKDGIKKDNAYMIGWWLTDAWPHKDGKACMFSQCKPKTITKLREALNNSDCKYSEYIRKGKKANHKDEHTFYVTGNLANHLLTEYHDRELCWSMLNWSYESRLELLDGLIDGDGSRDISRGYSEVFWSLKKNRLDIVQALCMTLNIRSHIDYKKGCVYLNRTHNSTQLQNKHHVDPIDYNGIVWCLKTKTGAFVVRRNGKIFISGNSGFPKSHNIEKALNKKGEIERAKEFKGFGTALKPACEPIVVARKPFKGSVVDNVLKHGCGGLNIDECRVSTNEIKEKTAIHSDKAFWHNGKGGVLRHNGNGTSHTQGRFPANVILDEEAAKMLDEQSGELKSGTLTPQNNVKATTGWSGGSQADRVKNNFQANSGGASRFFYVAKASKRERNEGLDKNTPCIHPTVKPIKLMQYLVKLVTPPNGTVLDPFMGSGSTGIAAVRLGFDFIGIEREKEYYNIAEKRINHEGDKYALI